MSAINLDEGMQVWAYYNAEPSYPGPANLMLRLFTNNWPSDQGASLSSFTSSTDSGLADSNIPGASSIYTNLGVCTVVYPQMVITASGGSGDTIYGALVYDSENNVALFATLFASPLVNPIAGQQLLLNVSFQIGSVNAA